MSKNIISTFSGRIGRNFPAIWKGSKWPGPYFWVLIWLMDINCDALIKLFFDFCNLSLTAFCVYHLFHVVVPWILLNSHYPLITLFFGTFTTNTAPKIFPVIFYLFDPPPLKNMDKQHIGGKNNNKRERKTGKNAIGINMHNFS